LRIADCGIKTKTQDKCYFTAESAEHAEER